MSEKKNSRYISRETLMKMLFQMEIQKDFSKDAMDAFLERTEAQNLDIDYIKSGFEAYSSNRAEIDEMIKKYSKGWSINRISKVDLCVLRLCLTEMVFFKEGKVPQSAAISEAVRIAKIYSGPQSGKFVNGILGKISKDLDNEQ